MATRQRTPIQVPRLWNMTLKTDGFRAHALQEGIEAGADAVMVAHIILPKLMEEPVPATISKEVVTGLLRKSSCLTVSSSPMP